MASSIDICNLALSHLGEAGTVQAIEPSDGSAEADACARFYPIARDLALASPRCAWSFATKRETLSLIEEDPTATWAFSYSVPNNYLRALKVLLPEATDDLESEVFEIETASDGNTVIYTNAEEAEIVFVGKVTDTTKWSPQFVIAVSHLLASFLAGPIAKDLEKKKEQMALYGAALIDAAAVDAGARHVENYKNRTPSGIKARQ